MKASTYKILNANQAVAEIAYKTNEVFPIYPITPSSEMSELVEQWSAENLPNAYGNIPSVIQMQSEAGVAGAMHGILQTGSLSTTFTASQGLLLMLPNMYKIAGELSPNVIHVATRSIATHALSIFGDHSDVMAVRQSGYAMIASASVQEAHDFALIAQASTLQTHIPFVHFFDGFRTSHEINTIETINNDTIHTLIDQNKIQLHRNRALSPDNPFLRGTSQGPDTFFQSREAINPIYDLCPDSIQKKMDLFGKQTNRHYKLFDYVGHSKAEYIIISMGSSTQTIETTIQQLNNQGEKYGLIKVRVFKPFSTKHLISILPKSVNSIAVLDRTKEAGASGEPLYLDILQSITEAFHTNKIKRLPRIVGGRYGLSSKEFTPAMVNAIFKNIKQKFPKNNFTIGINDDVKNLSLDFSEHISIKNSNYEAIFFQEKNTENNNSFKNTMEQIGDVENTFVQGYTECDYKKSNSYNISHLRISDKIIKAPYLIEEADFIGCQNTNTIQSHNVIDYLKPKGVLLVNTSLSSKAFWQSLTTEKQYQIVEKNINVFIVNISELKANKILKKNTISELHACFLAINQYQLNNTNLTSLKDFIYKVTTSFKYEKSNILEGFDSEFNNTLLGRLLTNKGNSIPVSQFPIDGTYPTNTSQFAIPYNNKTLPEWHPNLCTQCGSCSMACPQAALRIKAYNSSYLNTAPSNFKYINSEDFDLLKYTISINPEQCNNCNNCIDICPTNALKTNIKDNNAKANWSYFESIPEFDRTKLDLTKISQQQLQEPLFKYSNGVEACGEAPYLKLMSQLFGDRLLIANATGASSIFGGALPTTPWSKNAKKQGPAWSNSLFEDNAEFGLGFKISINQQKKQAKMLLKKLLPKLSFDLVDDILKAKQATELEISNQRIRVELLKEQLKCIPNANARDLLNMVDSLVKKSIWVVGGDGWAYDIGYGGLDHVIASGENINILVLDNEVYDNTGAQASKATPIGAEAKFAFNGKQKQKKDLGLLAMTYDNVYVASVAIGANQEQTLKAFREAESFDGPSLIIAYSHSNSHGINIKTPSIYHKAAVKSGQWLLYRNDPKRSDNKQNPFQLDSNTPSIKIEEYMKMEKRFSKLFKTNNEQLKLLVQKAQKKINNRYEKYRVMALSNSSKRWIHSKS